MVLSLHFSFHFLYYCAHTAPYRTPVSFSLDFFHLLNYWNKNKNLTPWAEQTDLGTPSRSKASRRGLSLFYLNPIIGHSLQMLHLAWCLAVSAAATLCNTGSQTMDCGSNLIQSKNRAASISGLLFACERGWIQTRIEGKKTHQVSWQLSTQLLALSSFPL